MSIRCLKLILIAWFARKERLVRTVCERPLAFALGRKLHYYDEPAVDKLAAAVREDKYRAERLVAEIVTSYSFQNENSRTMNIED